MYEATARPPTDRGPYDSGRLGGGLIAFAGILLFVIACFNMIYGFAAIGGSNVFVGKAHYVIGDLRAWGWAMVVLGVSQLFAFWGVLRGNQLARWFAVAVIGLNAIGQMLAISAYPLWSLTIIALDVVALYGLCAYGSRENIAA